MLVTMTAKNGVHSIKEFNEYSRKLRYIAVFLVSGSYLREDDRDYSVLQGVQDDLRAQVLERLKITHPEVLAPRQQYSIAQVTEAVRHILEATVPSSFSYPCLASAASTTTSASLVKLELSEVTEALRAMKNAFAQFQRAQLTAAPQQPAVFCPASRQLMSTAANASQPRTGPRTCIYCADPVHPTRCLQADADIATGIIKRNEQF